MGGWNGDLFELGLHFFISTRDDHHFNRHVDLENTAEDFLDRPDAETAR